MQNFGTSKIHPIYQVQQKILFFSGTMNVGKRNLLPDKSRFKNWFRSELHNHYLTIITRWYLRFFDKCWSAESCKIQFRSHWRKASICFLLIIFHLIFISQCFIKSYWIRNLFEITWTKFEILGTIRRSWP